MHQARDEWGEGPLKTLFPCMPGHEITGEVVEIGESVTRHEVGDRVGVGCMVFWGSEEQRGVEDEQLAHDGAFITVGMLEKSVPEGIDFAAVSLKRLTLAGSMIGSIAETQEVLDFCAEHDITADVEVIDIKDINEAFEAVVAGDVRFRYVIDSSTLDVARA